MDAHNAELFRDEQEAYRYVEHRVWPEGPVCPRCGTFDRIGKLSGTSTRVGTYKCYRCRKPFTVKIGTLFQSSHIPLHKWLRAIFLLTASPCPPKWQHLCKILEVSPKTAMFMTERIERARVFHARTATRNNNEGKDDHRQEDSGGTTV
jgi:transposase-like protein